ncbi:MAG: hypothetical protein HKN94_09500 [Acidimicrobiales bacterium]|nr:hypothetical protein [Acidimicrobiales bacterium]RZV46559.1 MAG: hypothetical protein EX269_06995 [Acidimicrobiales bacterium]
MERSDMMDGDTNNPWGDQAPPADPWAHPGAPGRDTRWSSPPAPTGTAVAAPSAIAPPTPEAPAGTTVVGAPVFSDAYGTPELPAAPAAPSGSGRAPWVLAMIGALTLLLGGGFFALTAFGAQGGAESPEAAVDALIDSMNNEDFITMGEMIDPAERRTIIQPVITDVLPELVRVGVFADDLDPAQVDGVDFNITNVEYEIDGLVGHPDVRLVWFTDGSSTSTFTAAEFPLGDALREFAGDDLKDDQQTTAVVDDGVPMVLVERDGRWFVSMWHTVAETARVEADQPVPSAADRPLALGSASPHVAVESFIAEMTSLDLEGLIGRLDPEEMDALYRYSPLFLDEAQRELDSLNREVADAGVSWEITDLGFDVETNGDDAVVSIVAGTLLIESPDVQAQVHFSTQRIAATLSGEVDGEVFEGTIEMTPEQWRANGQFNGEVVELEITFNHDTDFIAMSGRGFDEVLEGTIDLSDLDCGSYNIIVSGEIEAGCLNENGESVQSFVTLMEQLEEGFDGMAVKTRRTEGEWYVSPIGTSMDGMVGWLRSIEDDGIEQMLDSAALAQTPLGLVGGFSTINPDDSFVELSPTIEPDAGFASPDRVDFDIDPPAAPAVFVDLLPANGEHGYSMPLTAGQVVGVTVDGTDGGIQDPQVRIDGPTGSLAWADDEVGLNAALVFTAPTDGTYDIVVAAWDADPGVYELAVHVVASGDVPAIGSAGSDGSFRTEIPEGTTMSLDLSAGSLVHRGELTDGASDTFLVDVAAGSEWIISYEADASSTIDPYLSVLDESYTTVVENDDAVGVTLGSSYDSQVSFVAPADGTYVIEARSFGFTGGGSYTLTVTPAG